ncbi:MAG: hypothetical protein HQL87_11345 [Magnetococcales bacterium]|nr:hypothetical protein [Magnetococcales bacterium]
MNANKPDIKPVWIDPDDAPELTDEWFEGADLYRDSQLVRRGRPITVSRDQATGPVFSPLSL